MKNRYFVLTFAAIITGFAFFFSACKKINQSTELGGGLIPAVDNINTFDTSLNLEVYNDSFTVANDSLYIARTDEYWLGRINNDPLFGKTDARMFIELKPPFYKWSFGGDPGPGNLTIDSVVLVLHYNETYGDTTIPQTVNVYELDPSPSNVFVRDSAYLVRQNNLVYSSLLGSRTFTPSELNDSVKVRKDTTIDQLRIRLSDAFGQRLLNYDSVGVGGAYSNDSAFRAKFKGFAIQSMSSGNAVMGFDLSGTNTKLAIYYKYAKSMVFRDTLTYFGFNLFSASADFVQRDYTGTPLAAAVGGASSDPLVYIQAAPGTFAKIKIPGLAGLSNRLIHRAELIVEEAYDPSDAIFTPPRFLFVDAFDPVTSKYRLIPYDVLFDNSTGSLNLNTFGINPIDALDGSGNKIKTWRFNISRYVQHVLTQTQTSYELRLHAPFLVNTQYGVPPGPTVARSLFVNDAILRGRIRLVGNSGPLDSNPHRMRLRLVYSKL